MPAWESPTPAVNTYLILQIAQTELTGAIPNALSGSDHLLQIVYKYSPHFAKLSGYKAQNKEFTFSLGVKDFVQPLPDCVTLSNIQYVAIQKNGNDGWYIASVSVTAGPPTTLLTSDPDLCRWIDGDERDMIGLVPTLKFHFL